MAQNIFDQSHCKIFKTLVSQDMIKLWSWFCTCDYTCAYTFLDPTNQFNHFAFVSSGKHWFPDDINYVINGGYDDHNDDNSENNGNYVGFNNESDVGFMVIMIAMVVTVMVMKTTMINIIVFIIVIMMMVRH